MPHAAAVRWILLIAITASFTGSPEGAARWSGEPISRSINAATVVSGPVRAPVTMFHARAIRHALPFHAPLRLSAYSSSSMAALRHFPSLQGELPCYQYEIPPPECEDQANGGGGDYANDEYYNAETFPYPATFGFWGMISGRAVVGTAIRSGLSSAYNASFDSVEDDCFGTLVIDLSWTEAVMIEFGFSEILGSWRVLSSFYCD